MAPETRSQPAPVPQPLASATNTTITYTYDPLYRLKRADYSDGTYFQYAYDAVGNRLSEETTGGTVNSYTYDIANRLTGVEGVTYTWDNNGNLLTDGVHAYTYNHANRLVGVDGQVMNASYAYNGLGDRLQQTVGGATTDFTLDIAGSLSQVLSDETHTYLYGNGRIAQHDAAGAQYFLGDALGSVRQLTDASGVVTWAQSYQPYGEKLTSSGAAATSYGFGGEWTDEVAGLLYLRARQYAPQMGRFLQLDPHPGFDYGPQSFNGYSYAANNPVMYLDPSGECPPCWLFILLGIFLTGCQADQPAPTPTWPGPTPTSGGLFNGYAAILACGFNAGGSCSETEDYGGVGSLYFIRKQLEMQGLQDSDTILIGIDTFGGQTEGSKERFASYIRDKVSDLSSTKGVFLVGHSAGADAIVWAVSNMLNETQIRAIALLDPTLLKVGDNRGDTVSNGDLVNQNFPLYIGTSTDYRKKLGYYTQNSDVGLPAMPERSEIFNGSHFELAYNTLAAEDIMTWFTNYLP